MEGKKPKQIKQVFKNGAKKKKFKTFEVIRTDFYKFYVNAKNEEDLDKRLKENPDYKECGGMYKQDFTKREVKHASDVREIR